MDYKKMKVAELRALAEEKGIRGVTDIKKNELVQLLENIDKMRKNKAEEVKSEENKAEKAKTDTKQETSEKTSDNEKAKKKPKKKTSVKSAKMVSKKTPENDTAKASDKTAKDVTDKTEVKSVSGDADKKVEEPVEKISESETENMDVEVSENVSENSSETSSEDVSEEPDVAEGILEVMADGFGFIRSDNYMPGDRDIYVAPSQIRKFRLRTGDIVKGPVRKKNSPNEKFSALLYIESVNGYTPAQILKRYKFEDMTPVFPNERIHLDYTGAPVSLRIVDLFSPIGKGQRGMIVSPPKAGKTTLLKQIAKRISVANPDMNLLVLLIDERPEEVTDIKEYIEGKNAEVIYSTFDELPEHHKRVSEMVIERAKRLVESGQDVVILVDSITRLARAYNLTVSPSGRTLSGGLDPAALHMPKKFFGAARNMREGGSLTILATALIDTGSRMDDVVFEEFKGTGNMELVLDRNLQEKRVFPAIDISKSGTRKDDLLLSKDEQEILDIIHSRFHSMKNEDVTEDLLKLFYQTKNNEQFIGVARKLFQTRR